MNQETTWQQDAAKVLNALAQHESEPPVAGSATCYLPVGTRITFLRTIEEGPCEDHPGRLYAEKGHGGIVTGHGCKEGHWVKWDRWPHAAFGAKLGEDFKADNKRI